MKRLREVHALIHAMNQSEKRSYSLRINQGKISQPQQLFIHLVAQPEFSEKAINLQLKKHGLLAQLPTLLLRLRKSLLKILISRSTDRTVDSKLRFHMAEIELLFRKQLLNQIPFRLRKARKLAQEFSCFEVNLQLIQWEKKLIQEQQPNQFEHAWKKLRMAEIALLKALTIQRETADLRMRMGALVHEFFQPTNPSTINRFDEIGKHPTLEQARHSSDFLTCAIALDTLGLYQMALQNHAEALRIYTESMDAWKASPKWINEQADLFLANFNNFQISFLYSYSNNTDIPDAYAQFFWRHQFAEPKIKLRFQRIYFGNEMVRYLNSALFEEGQDLATDLETWLNQHLNDLPKSAWLAFQYNLAIYYFLGGNPTFANKRVQAILNFPDGDQRRDIRDFALIFELILQNDLDQFDLVEYRLRAARRYFSDSDRPSPLAEAVIAYFRVNNKVSPKEKLLLLRTQLDANPTSEIGLQEVRFWLKSKLLGISITEVFREELKKAR